MTARQRCIGLARIISKRGYCSRAQAVVLVRAGRVQVQRRTVRDPESPTHEQDPTITVDGKPVTSQAKVYLALNKPRGLLTTAADEHGRATVYQCLASAGMPWLAPVGRLDKASEGLLPMSNDAEWAARITSPSAGVVKTYHVQVKPVCAPDLLVERLGGGIVEACGEVLSARGVRLVRRGEKTAWLEIHLDEGRNRHIRRMLEALDVPVLRLIRIAIGAVALGELASGRWRALRPDEVESLVPRSTAL